MCSGVQKSLFAKIAFFAGSAALLPAQFVPNRYIVEFTGDPVALHLANLRKTSRSKESSLKGLPARARLESIRREQADMRAAILAQEENVEILDCIDTVSNACFLRMTKEQAGRVALMPGVKRVRQEHYYRPNLDHAVAIHRAPEVWAQIGFENAGLGMKIGMIDTGIDNRHPGFQDASLPMPPGFPQVGRESDRQFTSNKIIVARSYVRLLDAPDSDNSARDHVGHGTSTGMAAAGNTNTGPLATITGMAPKAYLGNYKVFGSPGVNDSTSDSALLSAINDAVIDGMDVLNLSLGGLVSGPVEDDALADAIYLATLQNVIVVVSAGNDGPDLNTIGSPAGVPSAIAAGAIPNDRAFVGLATIDGIGAFAAAPAFGPQQKAPITAPLVDVTSIDATGLACDALPAGSLKGFIALIPRNPDQCGTAVKLANARVAGAVAGLLFNYAAQPDLFSPQLGVSLPAEAMSYADGLKIQQALAGKPAPNTTLDFLLRAFPIDTRYLSDFTSSGPGPGGSIKPDLLAVGAFVYTAAESTDSKGDVYSPDGYIEVDGTSFSSPLVAGAAALIKGARPGLTAAQYKSLLINNAAAFASTADGPVNVQQGGAGLLDAAAAYRGTITAEPASLSFGVQGQTANPVQTVAITNVGASADTVTISVAPSVARAAAPVISTQTLQLAPGASQTVTFDFSRAPTAPGAYEGVIRLQSGATGIESRMPYFYAVPSAPKRIQIVLSDPSAPAGTFDPEAAFFRVVDENGVALKATIKPTAYAVSGGGTVVSVNLRDQIVTDSFAINVRLGPNAGPNVFRIQAGAVTKDVTILGTP
ncbi:MAG: S8 family serine peptidase [Bryobacteraceae bacterium]